MAVYTNVSDQDLETFIRQYDIGRLVCYKGIAEGVENSNYLVQTTKAAFILTLYEKRVLADDLPFFLGLMEHLSLRGLNCPVPIRGRDGQTLKSLNERPAAMVSFLPGLSPSRIELWHCTALGTALAKMHAAGNDYGAYRRPNALSVASWRSLAAASGKRANEVEPDLYSTIEMEIDFLEKWWPHDLPSGIIHADLFPDNVFFLENRLSGFIDFYFACNDLLAYDLAVCLNAWCISKIGELERDKAVAFFSSYDKTRPLTYLEKISLPVLARGAALRFLLTRLYDWLNVPEKALVQPKNPREYIAKLRCHQNIDDHRLYLDDVI